MDYFFVSIFGFALGVLLRSLAAFGWPALLFGFLFVAAGWGLWFSSKDTRYLKVVLGIIFVILGAIRVMLAPHEIPEAFAPLLTTKISLEGEIIADPDIRDTNQHVVVRTTREGETTNIIAYAPLYPALAYGERVTLSGMLQKPAPFDTDGGRVFRYDDYLAKDGIFSVVQIAQVEVTAPPAGFITKIFSALYGIKHMFAHGLENALPEPSAALAEGLITGGKQGLGKRLTDAFTNTGLVQIVVLSGYNVTVIAEGVLRVFGFLPRFFALTGAGCAIVIFILAAGSGSSAVRAGIMACLALYARATGRKYDALRALGAALFLMLLFNPLYLAYDPGFDLSVAATIGIIVLTPVLELKFFRIKNAFVREIIATTIAAQVFVLPLLLYQTGNLSLVALPANIIVTPIVPITMLVSTISGIAGAIAPVIAPAVGLPAYAFLSYIIAIAQYANTLPFAHITIPAFSAVIMIGAYAALSWFVWRETTRLSRSVLL